MLVSLMSFFTVSGNKKYMFGYNVSEFDDLFTVSGNKKYMLGMM